MELHTSLSIAYAIYTTAKKMIADHGEAALLTLSREDLQRVVESYIESARTLRDTAMAKDVASILRDLRAQ